MPDPNCPACSGLGYTVREDDGHAITCQCTVVEQIATTIKSIPGLGEVQTLGRGLVDFSSGQPVPLKGSAIIRCQWSPMLSHVAGWAFATLRRGKNPRVHITSCSRLKNMYFGNDEGKGPLGPSKLSRLESYDLVVVRLMGGSKNSGTQDALIEAIDFAKSIWLVHQPGTSFRERGHSAWSAEIDALMEDAHRIDLSEAEKGGVLAKIGLAPKGGHDA